MAKPMVSLAYQAMQSNMMTMRQIGSSTKQKTKSTTYNQTNWIHSAIRSLMHCIYYRLQYCSVCTIVLTCGIIFVLIISVLYENKDTYLQSQNVNIDHDKNLFTKLSEIESNIEQKIEFIETGMKSIKYQQEKTDDSISNIDINKELLTNLPNIQSGITEKIELIENELQSVKYQQEENSNTISNYMYQLKQEISSLKQQINNITEPHIQTEPISDFKKYFMDKLVNIQADIRKLNILHQEIENTKKTKVPKVEIKGLEKRIEIWDTFMIQQNEMNDNLLKLLQQNKENMNYVIHDKENQHVRNDNDRADFTVRVLYHSEIMTSSYTKSIQSKIFYFLTRKYDQNVIRPTGRSGDCTPLKQNDDTYIIVKLRKEISVSGVTVEYIKPSLLNNDIRSAPKNMSVEFSRDGSHYYNVFAKKDSYLMYNPLVDGAAKYFQFDRKTKEKYSFVKLNIISNHGAQYSCVYRVQVHGDPDPK